MAYDNPPQALYGVWIDTAIESNDIEKLKEVLRAARRYFPPPVIQPLYGVWIRERIEAGASREELETLLSQAEAAAASDLKGAVATLKSHLGRK
jgi:macrodomain Ter protein organizer (MatP/YcbG family)